METCASSRLAIGPAIQRRRRTPEGFQLASRQLPVERLPARSGDLGAAIDVDRLQALAVLGQSMHARIGELGAAMEVDPAVHAVRTELVVELHQLRWRQSERVQPLRRRLRVSFGSHDPW